MTKKIGRGQIKEMLFFNFKISLKDQNQIGKKTSGFERVISRLDRKKRGN